jgi:pyruvate formate lyase activating enzyme
MDAGIKFVYVGNIRGGEYEDTVCPKCGRSVIKRTGYTISGWNLDKQNKCTFCSEQIPIVGHREVHDYRFF